MAHPIPFTDVQIKSTFWDDIIKVSRRQSLGIISQKLNSYGTWNAMRLAWKPGDPGITPDILWDSGIGKYVEAASYALYHEKDPELQARVEEAIDMIISAQQEDGDKNGQLLDYPGHQEIELALMCLYDITRDRSLVDLAKFFIEERGRTDAPRKGHAWDIATVKRGDDPDSFFPNYWPRPRCYWHMQAHLPIREQYEIVGHSVQAMYWLSSVVDVALATEDQSYLEVVDRLLQNMIKRKMYVTGGIGSVHIYEGFGPEYDLSNETSYPETCAATGVMYLAQRKLKVKTKSAFSNLLELSLYNAMLVGLSLDGKSFNYDNPLATSGCTHKRSGWFKVFCCPSNICRILNSLGGYIYSLDDFNDSVRLTVRARSWWVPSALVARHGRWKQNGRGQERLNFPLPNPPKRRLCFGLGILVGQKVSRLVKPNRRGRIKLTESH